MSYAVQLYKNSSNPNAMNKSISLQATVECEFKAPMDRERPTIYISATDAYDGVNYVYIAEFDFYNVATYNGCRAITQLMFGGAAYHVLRFYFLQMKKRSSSFKLNIILLFASFSMFLGVISSFLGIGGGTSNVAVLFFFFSNCFPSTFFIIK